MQSRFTEVGTIAAKLTATVDDLGWTAFSALDFSSLVSEGLTDKDAFSFVTVSGKSDTETVYILLRDDGDNETPAEEAIELLPGLTVQIPCNQLSNGKPVFFISLMATGEVDVKVDAIFTRRF